MDLLPVPPASTNKVNSAINLANDGGSKSNTGYFNKKGAREEAPEEKAVDEVKLSTSNSSENKEDLDSELTKFFNALKANLKKLKDFIFRIFGFDRPKVKNIFKENNTEIT